MRYSRIYMTKQQPKPAWTQWLDLALTFDQSGETWLTPLVYCFLRTSAEQNTCFTSTVVWLLLYITATITLVITNTVDSTLSTHLVWTRLARSTEVAASEWRRNPQRSRDVAFSKHTLIPSFSPQQKSFHFWIGGLPGAPAQILMTRCVQRHSHRHQFNRLTNSIVNLDWDRKLNVVVTCC